MKFRVILQPSHEQIESTNHPALRTIFPSIFASINLSVHRSFHLQPDSAQCPWALYILLSAFYTHTFLSHMNMGVHSHSYTHKGYTNSKTKGMEINI